MAEITSFAGQYRFLSNFYPAKFDYMGYNWPTAEHAYQASKSIDKNLWDLFAHGNISAGESKRLGSEILIKPDWEKEKLHVMRNIVTAKFHQNEELMGMLLETKGFDLIEGNTWGDTFWGQSPLGKGRNELGKILMGIRDDITRIIL
jgi:ribA/ribD-fused uncharacterized protein